MKQNNKLTGLRLSHEGADRLFKTLESPPKANKKLFGAAKRYKNTVNVKSN